VEDVPGFQEMFANIYKHSRIGERVYILFFEDGVSTLDRSVGVAI
jgi:hypothetical protein